MKLHSTLIRAKQAVTSAIASLERNPQTKLHLQQLKTANNELDACIAEVPTDTPAPQEMVFHPELPPVGPGPDEKGPQGAEGTASEPLTVPQGVQTDGAAPGGYITPAEVIAANLVFPVKTYPDTTDAELAHNLADSEQGDPPPPAKKQKAAPARKKK